MSLLGIVAIISNCFECLKEAMTPPLTAEHWANKELHDKDIRSGMSGQEILKNARKGRYYLPPTQKPKPTYPEPHRDPVSGKIVIDNFRLYDEDLKKYDGYQIMQWAKQGKYNLSPEESKKELERYKEEQEALSKKWANRRFHL